MMSVPSCNIAHSYYTLGHRRPEKDNIQRTSVSYWIFEILECKIKLFLFMLFYYLLIEEKSTELTF